MSGYFKTAVLLAGLTALFMGIGYLIGGTAGLIIALVVALGMNLFAYWNSDKMVLSMQGAREVDAQTAPDLHAIVADLARNAALPMPKVYLIDNDQPNAFATGRDPQHAAVAATTGLLNRLSREEVTGVMAHELAHVRNRDTLIMTIAATIAGAIGLLANFALFFGGRRDNPLGLIGAILLMVLAPIGAMLVQTAISRSREFQADKVGAEISGQPLWLASALAKIEGFAQELHNPAAESNPATAHMFIINPLSAGSLRSMFSTHPKTQERIARLEAMAGQFGGDRSAPRRSGSVPSTAQGGRRAGPWG